MSIPVEGKIVWRSTLMGCCVTCLQDWHCNLSTIFFVVLACTQTIAKSILFNPRYMIASSNTSTLTAIFLPIRLRHFPSCRERHNKISCEGREGSANLLVEDGLCLTTITWLLPVVTPLSCHRWGAILSDVLRTPISSHKIEELKTSEFNKATNPIWKP